MHRRGRLADRQHQPVGPVEEGGSLDGVGDGGIVKAHIAQTLNFGSAEAGRRGGQRDAGGDYGVPAFTEIDVGTAVEQALDGVAAFGMGRGKARMDRGAENATIAARRRGCG
ncbi:MAG: hypothetical protein JWR75_1352 [Devosia sp.]|nr:hypothetical protein [Devosia sp.]